MPNCIDYCKQIYNTVYVRHLLFGIFAHPDDEAFGPSATLLQEVQNGTELHLICVTNGQNGTNPDNDPNLGETRIKEWKAAGAIIGASSMHALGYIDGSLCNQLFHDIAHRIEAIIDSTLHKFQPATIRFLTLDPNGLTGHIDHITVSNITTYIYYRLKNNPPKDCKITEIAYYCLPHAVIQQPSTDFVFMPAGRTANFINRTVDVRHLRDKKLTIMNQHYTQRKDAATMLAMGDALHNTDNFCVVN